MTQPAADEIAKRYAAHVTAVEMAPLTLERAEANVATADVAGLGTVEDWGHAVRIGGAQRPRDGDGTFEMMAPRGFLSDEGVAGSLAVMGRVVARPANVRKMVWLMPRTGKAVPYLG